jgi:hypothetical protein
MYRRPAGVTHTTLCSNTRVLGAPARTGDAGYPRRRGAGLASAPPTAPVRRGGTNSSSSFPSGSRIRVVAYASSPSTGGTSTPRARSRATHPSRSAREARRQPMWRSPDGKGSPRENTSNVPALQRNGPRRWKPRTASYQRPSASGSRARRLTWLTASGGSASTAPSYATPSDGASAGPVRRAAGARAVAGGGARGRAPSAASDRGPRRVQSGGPGGRPRPRRGGP